MEKKLKSILLWEMEGAGGGGWERRAETEDGGLEEKYSCSARKNEEKENDAWLFMYDMWEEGRAEQLYISIYIYMIQPSSGLPNK